MGDMSQVLKTLKSKLWRNNVAFLVLPFFAVLAIGQPAHAATVQPGLTISPLRTELTIAPGTVKTGQLTIYNTTTSDINVSMSAEAFGVINEQYDYTFDPSSKIASWAHFDPSALVLLAGKSAQVNYSIGIPLDAEPGGQYLSLFAATDIKSGTQGISTSERVGSLLYITVDGKVTHTGHLLKLLTPWTTVGSSDWEATIQNTGTTHFISMYTMDVKTLWDSEVSSSSGSSLILPSTIRLVQGTIAQPDIPGIYKITYTASLGDSPSVTIYRYILYMPVYGWIIIVLVLAYFAGKGFRIYRTKHSKKTETR